MYVVVIMKLSCCELSSLVVEEIWRASFFRTFDELVLVL